MHKMSFALLLGLNVVALYCGATPFFITLAKLPVDVLCNPEALTQAFHLGIEQMRNILFPSLVWLVGIAIANLAYAGVVVIRLSKLAVQQVIPADAFGVGAAEH